jgi:hypothetical protein
MDMNHTNIHNTFAVGLAEFQHFKMFTFSRQIHKLFRGTRTPVSPQKKSAGYSYSLLSASLRTTV